MQNTSIDSTSCKAHQHATGAENVETSQDIGFSRGGRNTKKLCSCPRKGAPYDNDVAENFFSRFK